MYCHTAAVSQLVDCSPRMWENGIRSQVGNKPKSLNNVVIAPLPNAQQQVRVSRVLIESDDDYKWMPRVTVGVARLRTITAQWP